MVCTIVLKMGTDCHRRSGSGKVVGALFMLKEKLTKKDGSMQWISQGEINF